MHTALPASAKWEVLLSKVERPVREKAGENPVVWKDVVGSLPSPSCSRRATYGRNAIVALAIDAPGRGSP